MIKTHITFIYTDTIHRIMGGIILVVGAILYTICEYKEPLSQILFYQEQYTFEYVTQGFYLIKFVVLMIITLLWVYSTKISRYNVYLFSRYSPPRVLFTKWLSLVIITLYPVFMINAIYIIIWTLYPVIIPISTVLTIFTSSFVWILAYHSLCFLFDSLFHHTFALMVPLFGFVLGMMFVGVGSTGETSESSTDFIQIIFPDILYKNGQFMFIYGPYLVLTAIVVQLLTIWKVVQRKDFVLFL